MNLGTIFKYAGLVFGAMQSVEAVADAPGGRAKQDAVVASVQGMLPILDATMGSSLATDPDVVQAMRGVTDAIVAFENLVARKRAGKPATAPAA